MEGIYHVYNRTIAKEPALEFPNYQARFLATVKYYRYPQKVRYSYFTSYSLIRRQEYMRDITRQQPLVTLFAYALMPNHFHFLLKSQSKNNVSRFISTIQDSYAKFYNLKNERDGALFQGNYKSRVITSNIDFIGVSKYIHLNPVNSSLIILDKLPMSYVTSLYYYKYSNENSVLDTNHILNYFGTFQAYWQYLRASPRG
jgi:putative transposase